MGVAEVGVIAAAVAVGAFLWWFFFGPRTARRAQLLGGVQDVEITVKGGYSPDVIRVTEGIPLRLRFDRQEAGDCTSRVVFPDFAASKSLPAFGTATLEFTPDQVGEFGFACGMNMIHGTLVVEPAGGAAAPADGAVVTAEAADVGPAAETTAGTEQAEFRVSGMSCASCVANIESVLGALPGVERVDVSFGTERAVVEFDPSRVTPAELQAAVADAGYRLVPRPAPGSADTED
ncbi:MAG TPA: copper ion binding protein, partial [Acidimicrobiia bacterium]